jgi:hypothetical protein
LALPLLVEDPHSVTVGRRMAPPPAAPERRM